MVDENGVAAAAGNSDDDHSHPYLKLDWVGTSTGHRTYYLRYKHDEGGKWTSMQGQTSYYDHGIDNVQNL